MNRADLVDQLPANLAVVIRLHDAGYDDAVLARALGVPEQSMPSTRRLAYAKLARLEADDTKRGRPDVSGGPSR